MAKGHVGGPPDEPLTYPPPELDGRVLEMKREYRDPAAYALYRDAGGGTVARAHAKLAKALDNQASKMEEFFNTPYTEDSARVLEASTRALVVLEQQLERWHFMLFPNQRPDS